MSLLNALKEELAPQTLAKDFAKVFIFCFSIAVLVFFLITLIMYPWQTIIAAIIGIFAYGLLKDLL